jgi:hydroxymethylpyrimidine/phosphomethylpyrimidine kinase
LLGKPLSAADTMATAAKELADFGSRSVLIKGGHRATANCTDVLYLADEDRWLELTGKRFATHNNHGTGCTLSSAIAAYLAKGYPLEHAVKAGKAYISNAIRVGAAYSLGSGHGPVHHFFNFWE